MQIKQYYYTAIVPQKTFTKYSFKHFRYPIIWSKVIWSKSFGRNHLVDYENTERSKSRMIVWSTIKKSNDQQIDNQKVENQKIDIQNEACLRNSDDFTTSFIICMLIQC